MASGVIKHKYITYEVEVEKVPITQAFGSIFQTVGVYHIDIRSLGLSKTPKILSAKFLPTSGFVAWCLLSGINKDEVDLYLCRPTSATVSGKIELTLEP